MREFGVATVTAGVVLFRRHVEQAARPGAHQDRQLQIVLPEVRFDRTYWIVTHADLQGLARVRAAMDHLVHQVKENKHIFKRQ